MLKLNLETINELEEISIIMAINMNSSIDSTNALVAFDEGERILILPLLAGSGLMLSCFENFRTGDRLKMPRLHATVVSCWLISISFVFLRRRCGCFLEVSESLLICFKSYCTEKWVELFIKTSKSCVVMYFLGKKRCVSCWTRCRILHVGYRFDPQRIRLFSPRGIFAVDLAL